MKVVAFCWNVAFTVLLNLEKAMTSQVERRGMPCKFLGQTPAYRKSLGCSLPLAVA